MKKNLAPILLISFPFLIEAKKKRNESVYVKEVAKTLAEIKYVSLDELARRTSENFKFLFTFYV